MYTLRDPICTYRAFVAGRLRRPAAFNLYGIDSWTARNLARTLGRNEANMRVMARLVDDVVGRPPPKGRALELFMDLVVSGRIVLREDLTDAYPLADPVAQASMALAEIAGDHPSDDTPRRTWISLELVQETKPPVNRLALELTTASGRELHGRLDADGRWRCEDIDGGTCKLRLVDVVALREFKRTRNGHAVRRSEDILWSVGKQPHLPLRSAQHHRIIIVRPPVPYCPSV